MLFVLHRRHTGNLARIISPEVLPDRRVTFRLRAAKIESMQLLARDIPGCYSGVDMVREPDELWDLTVGPLEPGAYRYVFMMNGVPLTDPHSPGFSQLYNNIWSLVLVPGSAIMDTQNVPHGAVASVTYYSTALSKIRRMHVYTPPGYEVGTSKLPVFYLLHGAGDTDDTWSSVGRANVILDNLIAAKKAVPMIVVMPAGHPSGPDFGFVPAKAGRATPPDDFTRDFVTDIMPFVENHYRTMNDRAHRAIAGLSMGGMQTIDIAVPYLGKFSYVGVFSSGFFGIVNTNLSWMPQRAPGPLAWEEENKPVLDNAGLKHGLKLLWFSTGKDDELLSTTKATVDMFKRHGFAVEFEESSGAHTFINWRNYLSKFAPRLFR